MAKSRGEAKQSSIPGLRAKEAFEELVRLDCDPEVLHGLLIRASDGKLVISSTPEQRIARARLRHQQGLGPEPTQPMKELHKRTGRVEQEISLKRMDSLKILLDPFTTADLEDLLRRVKRIREELDRVNRTWLVRSDRELFQHRYAFDVVSQLDQYVDKFLPAVIKKANQVASKRRPWRTRRILDVLDHVKQKTGSFQYRLVTTALGGYGCPVTESGLQQMVARRKRARQS